MTGNRRCEETRELIAELALGIADGEERARALEHVTDCADCRRELDELSAIADELLELAPEHEPPIGFELRAVRALEPARTPPFPRRRRWRQLFAVGTTGLVASAVAASAVLVAVRDDRRVAGQYRATLTEAHGSYFGAGRLRDAGGAEGGVAFVYRGAPSWLVITVDRRHRDAAARAVVVDTAGHTHPLPWFRLYDGTWGGPVPTDLRSVAAVRVLGADGRVVLEGGLRRGDG